MWVWRQRWIDVVRASEPIQAGHSRHSLGPQTHHATLKSERRFEQSHRLVCSDEAQLNSFKSLSLYPQFGDSFFDPIDFIGESGHGLPQPTDVASGSPVELSILISTGKEFD